MSDGLDEAEIVRGLRLGDRFAWEALCQRYSRRVWQYVSRLVGSDMEAVADVFQETILAVAKAGRNLSEESRLWAWLARIGHNQAALYWRKQYRLPDQELDEAALEGASFDHPFEALERLETVESVRRLLSQMNADQVAILMAKYLDGLTAQQIAESDGGSIESVRSRLARARNEFRRRYEQQSRAHGSAPSDTSPREGDLK